ncbi:30S ribosomal protein S6 [Desulfopila sp. IMCC35008]|uniref:30S ribosomal protein S6 n=1 Tax=Desulfopila sp. IMCC35008 TaxID=2653858 RepID=UPI0013D4100D|nr:30S ribosomal protein S6 [Desulfopila sp. IMCC35008]
MRRYELIFILRPSIGEEEINKVVDYSQTIISDEGGSVIDLNKWGMKKLAYPIKKEIQGYYVFCDYAGTPAAVSEIERRFRIDDSVLKYLTIKIADSISEEEIQQAITETQARNDAAVAAEETSDETAPKADEPKEDTVEESVAEKPATEEPAAEESAE